MTNAAELGDKTTKLQVAKSFRPGKVPDALFDLVRQLMFSCMLLSRTTTSITQQAPGAPR